MNSRCVCVCVCVCVWYLHKCILVTVDELCKVLRAPERRGAGQIIIIIIIIIILFLRLHVTLSNHQYSKSTSDHEHSILYVYRLCFFNFTVFLANLTSLVQSDTFLMNVSNSINTAHACDRNKTVKEVLFIKVPWPTLLCAHSFSADEFVICKSTGWKEERPFFRCPFTWEYEGNGFWQKWYRGTLLQRSPWHPNQSLFFF